MPPLDHLNTGFLAALQSAGIDRNAVDVVVNTHIHSDHVGWNTMLDNDAWVPTFPNARYLAPAADYHHFAPDGPAARQAPRSEEEAAQQRGNQLVFADSVAPIDEAGQLVALVGRLPDQSVAATAARPRTHAGLLGAVAGCGSAGGLRRRSHPQPAATAPTRATPAPSTWTRRPPRSTRRRIFTEAAQAKAAVIPAHYPGRGGATIRAVEDQFDIDHWLDIEPLHRP